MTPGLIRFERVCFRVLAPKWAHDPLSGEGAARFGGRFNEKGAPALYLSLDLNTAVAEYQQETAYRPGTFCAYSVSAARIADLTAPEGLAAFGIESADLVCEWKRILLIEKSEPPSWRLARMLMKAGMQGALVPSVLTPGVNLVLWKWNEADGAGVAVHDPQGELPKDQRSWKLKDKEDRTSPKPEV